MENDNAEVVENTEEQDSFLKEASKGIIFVIVIVAVLLIFATQFLFPALEKTDHGPTSVITESQDEEGLNEFFERF